MRLALGTTRQQQYLLELVQDHLKEALQHQLVQCGQEQMAALQLLCMSKNLELVTQDGWQNESH
jgi:IS1 family transposase